MTNGPLLEDGIYIPTWVAIGFVANTIYVLVDCIRYFWKLFTEYSVESIGGHRANPEDLNELRIKLKADQQLKHMD